MKKVLFFAVALVALAGMASCANKEKATTDTVAQDSIVEDTNVNNVDTAIDSVVPEAEK